MKRVTFIALLATVAAARPAQAQTKVAVINVEEVFAKYRRPAVLEEEIRARQKGFVDEADQRRQAIDRKRQALQAYKPGTPDHDAKAREIRRDEIEFQVWRTLGEEEIKLQHKNSFRLIYDDVRAGVAALAKERGIDLVLTYDTLTDEAPDSQSLRQQILLQKVIYWSPHVDITADVIERINATFEQQNPTLKDPSSDAEPVESSSRYAAAADSAKAPGDPAPGAGGSEKPAVPVTP